MIDTLKECDVTGCGRLLGISWDQGRHVIEKAVARGLARKQWRIPSYIGINEKSFAKQHTYNTLVCDLRRGTVEYVVENRSQDSLEAYYRQFDEKTLKIAQAVAMDLWDPYIAATRQFIYVKNARKFFQRRYFWATHSRLPPLIRVAKTLKIHLQNILTYFRHRIANATAEGLNSKIQMVKEMTCGFRDRTHYKPEIYFHCGALNLYPCLLAS